MKTEQGIQLLVPTVQYGNITLISKITLDSEVDGATVKDVAEARGLQGSATSLTLDAARILALDEVQKLKTAINKLAVSAFDAPPAVKK